MTDRKAWKTGLSIGCISHQAMKDAAAAGLDLVEINAIDDSANWEKIPQWEKETGVKVWSFHLPFSLVKRPDDPEEEWEEVFPLLRDYVVNCGAVGIKHMILHSSGESHQLEETELREVRMQRALAHITQLSDVCKANGCVLCVEVLPRFCLGNSSAEIQRIMDSNSDLRLCFDVNHLLKEDHVEFIRNVGEYAITTHISDYDFIDERHWFPLEGQIPWKNVQDELEKVGYEGPFMYEVRMKGHTWSDVVKNHEALKNL